MDTKKQLILVLLFALAPVLKIHCSSLNIVGDTIAYPYVAYNYSTAENVGEKDKVLWEVINGLFTGEAPETNNRVIGTGRVSPNFLIWKDIIGKGKITYSVLSSPDKNGYADVEILSLNNSQVDYIKVGNFRIASDTIYIPKGERGAVTCTAEMIFPSTINSSKIPVTKFEWQLPPSFGGIKVQGKEFILNYFKDKGDGEKIIITPYGYAYGNDRSGVPRIYTIKRTEGVIENRDITGTETFQWENLLVRDVNIFSGANVTMHGNISVRLKPEFRAYKGSNVHVTVSGINSFEVSCVEPKSDTGIIAGIDINDEDARTGFSQNYPNPCAENTNVDYCLPESTVDASIYIVSSSGQAVRIFSISGRGNQVLNLDVSGLSPGIYQYYIVADGKRMETKSMIIMNR